MLLFLLKRGYRVWDNDKNLKQAYYALAFFLRFWYNKAEKSCFRVRFAEKRSFYAEGCY